MKKAISLLLTAIMVFCLLPIALPMEAHAAAELVVSGGSYYYDGHEHTVTAEVKDDTGYTIQYSYYSIFDKATWSEEPPKVVEPGSLVVYVRAVKGTDMLSHDPVLLEVVGNAPAGSAVKIIAHESITKASVYEKPSTTSAKVGEFNAGDVCTLVSQDGQWFEISDGTVTGWVFYEFVTITSRPNGGGGGGTPDYSKIEIHAYGGTYLYDGNVHRVKATMVHGDGFTLEFSVDDGKTWTTTAPGLTSPGTLNVKVRATCPSLNKIKEAPDVVLTVVSSLPAGTKVKIIAHESTTVAPVRKAPSKSAGKVGTVPAGKEVNFLGKENEWVKITDGTMEGYVYYWFVDLENIEIKPQITVQPESIWVMKDEIAVFKVVVTGIGTITHQWQWYDSGTWKDVTSGGTSPSYSFKAGASDDGKKVRCVITDSNGTVTSDEATLTVISGKPVITKQPENGGSTEGKIVRFIVAAQGAQSFQWYYQKPDTTEWLPVDDESAHTSILSVKITAANNGYKFKCKLSNVNGDQETNEVTLMIVKNSPKITVQPTPQTATEGGSVTFTITATGDAVTYQWQRKLKGGKWENCTGASAKTASYTETGITYSENNAYYRCIVQNAKKKVTSKNVKLKVNGLPPTISVQPSPWNGPDGSTATFSVTATGSGTVTYYWEYLKPTGTKWKKCSGAKSATYSFKATAKKNGYKYRCVVTNNGTPLASSEVLLTVY